MAEIETAVAPEKKTDAGKNIQQFLSGVNGISNTKSPTRCTQRLYKDGLPIIQPGGRPEPDFSRK